MGPGARAARGLPPTDDPDWKGCGLCGAMVAPGKAGQHNNFHDLIAGRVEEVEGLAKRALASSERRREELEALARSILSTQERQEELARLCAEGDGKLASKIQEEGKRITTVAQASLRHAEGLTRAASAIASVRDVLGSLRAVVLRHESTLKGQQ